MLENYLLKAVNLVRNTGKVEEALGHGNSRTEHLAIQLEKINNLLFELLPFKIGQRVKLKEAPVIDEKTAWGWLSSKHFLIKGAKATIRDVHIYDGKVTYLLAFDNETWIKEDYLTGEKIALPREREHLYSFRDLFIEAI